MASAGSGVESRWNLALAQARSFRTIPRARVAAVVEAVDAMLTS
jgi:hypothetical protein